MTPLDFLFIFAHPDDEAFYSGGLLSEAQAIGLSTHVLCLTPGNRPERTQEFWSALACFQSSGTLARFPDGLLQTTKHKLLPYLCQRIVDYKPRHIVTFGDEPHYNHRDHLVVEELVTQAWQQAGPVATLWKRAYIPNASQSLQHLRAKRPITHSVRLLESVKLATHELPNLTVPLSPRSRTTQLRSLACHVSQNPQSLIEHVKKQPLIETYSVYTNTPSHIF